MGFVPDVGGRFVHFGNAEFRFERCRLLPAPASENAVQGKIRRFRRFAVRFGKMGVVSVYNFIKTCRKQAVGKLLLPFNQFGGVDAQRPVRMNKIVLKIYPHQNTVIHFKFPSGLFGLGTACLL